MPRKTKTDSGGEKKGILDKNFYNLLIINISYFCPYLYSCT